MRKLGYRGHEIVFRDEAPIARKRVDTFLTKEPDTVEWLGTLGGDDVLWDIGANIGIYALPAATVCREVWAFEPHPANYHELWHNCRANPSLRVRPVHMALASTVELATLRIPDASPGAAMTSISAVGYRGRSADVDGVERVRVPAFPGDFMPRLGVPAPTVVKIDVDGVEPDIVSGLAHLLKETVREALIETDVTRAAHMEMVRFLKSMGFDYDVDRAERARRTSGPNAGVGNILFVNTPGAR